MLTIATFGFVILFRHSNHKRLLFSYCIRTCFGKRSGLFELPTNLYRMLTKLFLVGDWSIFGQNLVIICLYPNVVRTRSEADPATSCFYYFLKLIKNCDIAYRWVLECLNRKVIVNLTKETFIGRICLG